MDLTKKPFCLGAAETEKIEQKIRDMSLEEKCGQLFCVLGTAFPQSELIEIVRDFHVGGVLFRPDDADVIRRRYAELDEVAKIPLLKCANLEEGGAGAIAGGTYFANQLGVAACDDVGVAEDFADVCASEAQSVGVNCSFSPVCDINYNFLNPITNVRTLGSDKERVRTLADHYVKRLQQAGVAAFAKHFPGDGVDYRDQHLHVSVNSLSAKEWYESFGAVYRKLIDDGLLGVMVGHIAQPSVTQDINPAIKEEELYMPASLNPDLLYKVLRERLAFNGVITTDATIMGGYTMSMERKVALPYSIASGCDMLVFNTDFKEDYAYMLEGVKSGILSEKRLDDAVRRVLALKARVCKPVSPKRVDAAALARKCADKCVTLVKNRADYMPVTKYKSVRLVVLGKDALDTGEKISDVAKNILDGAGIKTEVYTPETDDLHGTKNLDKSRLTLYLANVTTESNKTTTRIDWFERHAMDMPRFINEEDVIFVSLNNPYHLQDVPHVKVYINAYSATKLTLEHVMDKLLKGGSFTGLSPVDAFCGMEQTKF